MLHQAQQGGPGGHHWPACLFLGQPVQAAAERTAVLVDERFELSARRQVDDILSECCWE
jgi:hypothetical protein